MLVGALPDRRDLSFCNATPTVGTWDHSQRAISFSTGIEMKTDGKHMFQHGGRRLDVKNAGFDGPRSESVHLDPILNSDGYVLVPRHFPICFWNFIEKDSPHRIAFSSKYRLNQMPDGWRAGKLPYFRGLLEQISDSEDTGPLLDASPLVHPRDGSQKFLHLGRRNNGLARGETALLHLVANR